MHTVRAAAELALSVLPHAHALNFNEIQRAVLQCKEQSDSMLERACLIVEEAAKGTSAYYFISRISVVDGSISLNCGKISFLLISMDWTRLPLFVTSVISVS